MIPHASTARRWPGMLAVVAGLLVGMPFAAPATAQQLAGARPMAPVQLGSAADPFWGRQGDYICRRWCLEDRTPCDPVNFKAADSRCFDSVRSFYGVLNCRIRGETNPECPTAQ